MVAVIPVHAAGEPSDNALTRGNRFTVNITGLPSTPYYIWLTRTSSMTGKPGDQPPVIVPFQSGIQQDPPEGPFTIGSYMINNGNGRTIRDDIAPSTPELSNTNYYALVTTDTDGRAVVAFQTSSATSTKTFSIKVENSRSAANSDILIERGLPTRIPTTIQKGNPCNHTDSYDSNRCGNDGEHHDIPTYCSNHQSTDRPRHLHSEPVRNQDILLLRSSQALFSCAVRTFSGNYFSGIIKIFNGHCTFFECID